MRHCRVVSPYMLLSLFLVLTASPSDRMMFCRLMLTVFVLGSRVYFASFRATVERLLPLKYECKIFAFSFQSWYEICFDLR